MRRLWSYIILTGTALVAMGTTFANVFKQSSSNIEYSNGKELVFRITEKDGEAIDENITGEKPSELIADKIVERLASYDISTYEVRVQGNDTVSVLLKQQTEANYKNIQELVTFNGSLALSSKLDNFISNADENEKWIDGKAYLETVNNYPSVNIPVTGKFYDLLKQVKQYKEDNNTDAAEQSSSGEGEEAETTYTYNLYLWKDYVADTDTFSKTVSGNEDYDSRIAEKIIMSFNVEEIEDDAEKITAFVNIQDKNNNSSYEASEVRSAFDTARHYVNLLNCDELDYKVTFLYENSVPAFYDELVTVDENIQWSYTLKATICAIGILTLLLIVFYRLGALSVATLTLGSLYASVGSIILFTAEFNTAGLIALCLVALASIASGIIYLTKLKEESYRGRSLKKANSEASKKALLPIVDVNVVLIIMGVFSYIFGGTIMRTFAIVAVLGGLASLILNTVGLKALMWLATNTTKLQGKYDVFGIDSTKVPNVLKEEKQTYFGPYDGKDFTKKKKPIGIITSLLFIAGMAGMIVFGSIHDGVVYNNGSETLNSQIYFETNSKNTLMNENQVTSLLGNVYTYTDNEAKAKSLLSQISDADTDILYKTREDIGEDEDDKITYTYYVVKLNNTVDLSKTNAYYVTKDDAGQEIGTREYALIANGESVSSLLEEKMKDIDTNVKASVKNVTLATEYQPEFAPIMWGTLVGIAVSALYLLLRYRLSRGLAALVAPIASTGIVTGLFALSRLAVGNYAVVAAPVVAALTLFFAIIFMNRERELVIEDKNHDNSIANRDAIMVRATALSYSPILILTIFALYLGINFFGFGAVNTAWLFLIIALGVVVAAVIVTTLYGPIAQLFYRMFSKVNMEKFQAKFKKKKKKVNKVNKSAEPEERIFIGIND